MSVLEHTPRFTNEEALQIARELFGIDGVVSSLPSERDQNFRLTVGHGTGFVLKIANGCEERGVLEAQQGVITRLGSESKIFPQVIRTLGGRSLAEVVARDGKSYFVWLITLLPGVSLGEVSHHPRPLLEDLGRQAGEMNRRLAGFDHPSVHRDLVWDLANGLQLIEQYQEMVTDKADREWVEHVAAQFRTVTAPLLPRLRQSTIHNDLNDYNLLVETAGAAGERHQQLSGIIDFGDLVWSWTVGELAILLAYSLLNKEDPLAAAEQVVRGYHTANPLTEDEIDALFGLVCLRLATSVVMAARQHRQRPGDSYLLISQEPIQRILPRLRSVPWGLVTARFRVACGWPGRREEPAVLSWLRARAGTFEPVLRFEWQNERWVTLDLSVASPLIDGDPEQNSEPLLTQRVSDEMREASAVVAVGRYEEARMLYTSPLFRGRARATEEQRTVHLGIDIFTAAGTAIFAPLPGRVVVAANNRSQLDYGPLIVLEHEADDGGRFLTLYGHLSEESLTGMEAGREIAAGEQIGSIGRADVNGGWTPHLHFQLILDDLGLGADFPGVCRASERKVWGSFSPDPSALLGIPTVLMPVAEPTKAETLVARRRRLGSNLSIGYREPIKVVRGWRQYLLDETGRRYIDAYNNVPHVGHCHPRVVEAGVRQMRVLNTNTRYLHDLINRYAERLCATLPGSLGVCYFVNSASEANELALRLIRAHTRRKDLIVLEGAYHGHTTSLIDISPYKHDGPGGEGAPDWVQAAPVPDLYRGRYRADDSQAAVKYASEVAAIIERLAELGRAPGGFIAETCPSVGGQIFFPPGYLSSVYRLVRKAGGICVADEVQTGYGRIGTHFWAFEAHGVVPDMVVMGKPIGNGHPIGAVVTTAEIAASFDNGMEFFSTFGGNPVSCAIGLAVLDVLDEEGLQAHAQKTGDHLLARLRPLLERSPLVGDVRGSGLFLGIELVRDRITLTPAAAEASYVANRLREEGILLGTDGPHHNVVKIRPPMPFAVGDADQLAEVLTRVLDECL
ncbi:MAG: aminotransferase class III-fold pyridoxal phosphate-dependent enzyme [Acidobacteria bacterium]|nr:aminotransferase class III-fold pyridoxal phosphate-dependent enzyme [Acidobacteriota bacterium]